MDGSGYEMYLMQKNMRLIYREEVKNSILFTPDMSDTEKDIVGDILNGLDMQSIDQLNYMLQNGIDVNGPYSLHVFGELVSSRVKTFLNKKSDHPGGYDLATGVFAACEALVDRVAARIVKIDQNFRKPISSFKGIGKMAETDDYIRTLLSESPERSLYSLAREIPEAKLSAMAETLGVKETARLIKLGGVNILVDKASRFSGYINDEAKIAKLLRGRIVITNVDDAKSIVRFLQRSKNISKGFTAVAAVLSYANLFFADEKDDKVRMLAGDTGQFIGSMIGSSIATATAISIAEYAAASIASVALVSNPAGWVILGVCAAAGAYAGMHGGNTLQKVFEREYDTYIKPHEKAIVDYLIQAGKLIERGHSYGY